MSRIQVVSGIAFLCLLFVALSAPVIAQAERPLTWQQDLNYLANAASVEPAELSRTLTTIRIEVEAWLKLHPDARINLPPALFEGASAEQLHSQARALQQVVENIVKQDPNRPFHLGVAEVNVNATVSELSPIADSIDQAEMSKHNELNAASALEYLPGVSLNQGYAGRNQVQAQVHGFGYLQVPLFMDGIPVNDPYDGTLDFRQFSTIDVSEVQVAKGFSSPLMGPNAVGGAINIVTKAPQEREEGDLLLGGYSGNGLVAGVRVGTRMKQFFAQSSMDWVQQDYIPLSGNFTRTTVQPNDQLNHSDEQNARYTGRFGWTPRREDQYVFTYSKQRATSGIPLDPGNNPVLNSNCYGDTTPSTSSPCYGRGGFRSWNFWEKRSYYFHSNTMLGAKSSFKTRVFYDEYPNLMYFYNGFPYTYSNLKSGFNTLYDDHSDGFTTAFETRLMPRNTVNASFFFKDDTHREIPYPTTAPPYLADRQQTASIGAQDVVRVTPQLLATVGFSADHIDGLHATGTASNGALEAFVAPACPGNTDPKNYSACTPHTWAYNPQASATYLFHDSGRAFAGFAEKTRFAVLKEMYSSKMGQGLPNPDLKPEKSFNWVFGYSRPLAAHTVVQAEYFLSNLHHAIENLTIVDPGAASGTPNCPNSKVAGTCGVDENATQERHQGVELIVRSTPVKILTLNASYTYVNKEVNGFAPNGFTMKNPGPCGSGAYMAYDNGQTLTSQNDNSCLTPTDYPKHKAVFSTTARLPHEILATALVRYESGTKAIDTFSANKTNYAEVMSMSNFATVDLSASAPLYKAATVQAGVRNLFDRNYFYVLDIPEAGRNWFVNMRYRF